MNVGSQHRLQFTLTNMVKSQFVEVCFALDRRRRRHVGHEPKAFLVTRIFNPEAVASIRRRDLNCS